MYKEKQDTNMNYLNTNSPAINFRKNINSEIYTDKSLIIDKSNQHD